MALVVILGIVVIVVMLIDSELSSEDISDLDGTSSVLSLEISADSVISSDSVLSIVSLRSWFSIMLCRVVASPISVCNVVISVRTFDILNGISTERLDSCIIYTGSTHTSLNSRKFLMKFLISELINLQCKINCSPIRRQARGT